MRRFGFGGKRWVNRSDLSGERPREPSAAEQRDELAPL
jgi:hypothetical protein